jgi:hypothetical protein|tara:strand:+ start:6248 stop:6592 length:345 start_codon:yes stop_codon:yes gene_type:complete
MQDSNKDSTISYNQEELKIISIKLISANECDTMLKISEKLGQYKDSVVVTQDNIIAKQELQLAMYDTIVNKQAGNIEYLGEALNDSQNKLKITKVAFYSTATAFVLSFLYIILN